MFTNILSIAFGVAVIAFTLSDVFQVVVMPRATGRNYRISFFVWRAMWYVWPKLAWRLYGVDADRREDFLAVFAPLTLVSMIGIWAGLLILGFGSAFWGMHGGISPSHTSFGSMLYFAGTSLLTIGYGDIVGRTALPRFASVLAALAGLSYLSILTAFLFAIFGSFQLRETFVVTVAARAGSPPSGVNLLAIAGYSKTFDDLPRLMVDAQRWAAAVMESHLAYPMLAFFRSSHDDQSWIGTLGTLLDAATLAMTTIDGVGDGQARIFYSVGRHAARDLSHYFNVGIPDETVGVERAEFDRACDRLAAAGYTLRDRDEAWSRFSGLRSGYAGRLNVLAAFFQSPPLQWVGDRSLITVTTHGDLKIHEQHPSGAKTS
jgi:hypothetical protein